MKTIKLKSSYLLSTALFLSLVVTSCDLNEIPTSFVEPKDYYQTKEQCEAGLNACYIPLNPIFNYTYLIAMEGCTDLMYVGQRYARRPIGDLSRQSAFRFDDVDPGL